MFLLVIQTRREREVARWIDLVNWDVELSNKMVEYSPIEIIVIKVFPRFVDKTKYQNTPIEHILN